jgi:phage tail tape-measure protein
LIGAGIPEERVKHYQEGIQNGGILMGVTPRSEDDARYLETQWQRHEGQHVIGTGAGATAGAVAGAGVGAVGGPVGMAAGAAVGAVAGGLAGKGAAEVVNPKPQDDLADHHLATGTGVGAGAAAGAAVGAAGGPVGMAAGAAIGAVAGGAAGKGTAEVVNPKPGDKSRA